MILTTVDVSWGYVDIMTNRRHYLALENPNFSFKKKHFLFEKSPKSTLSTQIHDEIIHT